MYTMTFKDITGQDVIYKEKLLNSILLQSAIGMCVKYNLSFKLEYSAE